jgi:hypothetical protein
MSKDKISSMRRNKRRWFSKERKSKGGAIPVSNRFFNAKIKDLQETFLTEHKEHIERHNPALPYLLRNKPIPKKYQVKIPVAAPVLATSTTLEIKKDNSQRANELDKFQESRDIERQAEIEKIRQDHLNPKIVWKAEPKRNRNHGMRWVNANEANNKGKLGHSQSWKFKSPKKYEYY